jgi:prophage tail gpP-like protein
MRTTRDDTIEGAPIVPPSNAGTTVEGDPVVAPTTTTIPEQASDTVPLQLDPVDVTAKAPAANNNPTANTSPVATEQTSPTANSNYQPTAPVGGDDLTLMIGNMSWSGWQSVRLMRSLDTIPANFDIAVTERYPTSPDIDIKPGDVCKVQIGGDLVLTGYIDRYRAQVDPTTHTVEIIGRSKSADLVDCAAFIGDKDPNKEQYQLPPGNTLSVVKALAAPYGIEVNSTAGDGVAIPKYPISLGETAWELIDRITKYSQVVVYDMPDGSLMMATAGEEAMASGFVQGVNIERAEVDFTMDQRYSIYEGFQTAVLGLTLDGAANVPPSAIATDTAVTRFRKKIIISEQNDTNGAIIDKRVNWEAARRAGRSTSVLLTCDSWRDTSNNLWTPNHIADVQLPALKIADVAWVIGQVTYIKDENGRHAEVLLMPANAFLPEPLAFIPIAPTLHDMNADKTGNPATNPTTQTPTDTPPATSIDPPTVEGDPVVQPPAAPLDLGGNPQSQITGGGTVP